MHNTTETNLPKSLVGYIDRLGIDTVPSLGEAYTVDLCLTYGSDEQQDGQLEMLDAELRGSSEAYISDLEMFLSTSPDYGLPSFVNGHYDDRPQHQPSGWALHTWLEIAQKHLPGAEDEVMAEIVTCITDCFDSEQFELAVPVLLEDQSSFKVQDVRNRLHRRARELCNTTREALCSFATSPGTIRCFLDSSFMRSFGDDFSRIVLEARILELNDEQASPAYMDLVVEAGRGITAEAWYATSNRLSWMMKRDPEAVLRLIHDQPEISGKARSFGRIILDCMKQENMTDEHRDVLINLEGQASNDIGEYASFIQDYFKKTRTFKPEHISNLKALVETTGNAGAWAYQVLCAHLAIDEVVALIEKHPESLADLATVAICVRRFAAEGYAERAHELALTTNTRDSSRSFLEPIRNLLAIYDETGNETYFLEADEQLRAKRNSGQYFYLYGTDEHEILARTLVAARRHGHVSRVEETLAAMEPFYSHEYSDVRDRTLSRMLRIALDDGDLETAEQFAVRLQSLRERSGDDRDKDKDGILHVLSEYVKAGDIVAATNLVQTYFATEKPDWRLKAAIALLNNETPAYMPSLYISPLNPITNFMGPER